MPTEKRLNRSIVEEALEKQGLTQTALGEAVGKTKQAVSKWIKGQSFPRPPELLKLSLVLKVGYKQLVEVIDPEPQSQPIVAFRRRANCKTTDEHYTHAKAMGRWLSPLVDYLSVDEFFGASSLKEPSVEYDYVQALVKKVRLDLGIDGDDPIKGKDLLDYFEKHQAILIPVMWGKKDKHENALHIHLPESKSTWIYLNLDTNIPDFKFWMAHELGHVISVDLIDEDKMDFAEDFADAFAGALIFPKEAAATYFEKYAEAKNKTNRMKVVNEAILKHSISPFSVYKELEKFAKHHGKEFGEIDNKTLAYGANRFIKKKGTVSQFLFGSHRPNADEFIRKVQARYKTEFFTALEKYLNKTDASDTYVKKVLNLPVTDAKAIFAALKND